MCEEDAADVSVSVPRGQVQGEAAPTVFRVGRALVSEEQAHRLPTGDRPQLDTLLPYKEVRPQLHTLLLYKEARPQLDILLPYKGVRPQLDITSPYRGQTTVRHAISLKRTARS